MNNITLPESICNIRTDPNQLLPLKNLKNINFGGMSAFLLNYKYNKITNTTKLQIQQNYKYNKIKKIHIWAYSENDFNFDHFRSFSKKLFPLLTSITIGMIPPFSFKKY